MIKDKAETWLIIKKHNLQRCRCVQVNVYGFLIGIIGKSSLTQFTTDTRLLVTTERNLRVQLVVAVHPNGTGFKFVSGINSARNITGEDCCCQTINGIISLMN